VITGGWRGPGWRIVDASPRHARQIRHWISSAISSHPCPADAEEAALVADELFANAVLHGPRGGRVLAGYCLWRHGARIVVADGGGPGVPRLRPAATSAEGGRGLHLVDELAARWDTMLLAGARVVWCDLHTPLHVPAAEAWAWLPPVLSGYDLAPRGRLSPGPACGVLAGTGAR
jgi:anti-sigma regulatory factor (Ser/Thr protein kinase)